MFTFETDLTMNSMLLDLPFGSRAAITDASELYVMISENNWIFARISSIEFSPNLKIKDPDFQ